MNPSLNFGMNESEPREVIVNNRVLFKMGGKAVTVMDIIKRMDVLLHQRFPQLASSPAGRYQFYLVNWETVLHLCIDDQLILADAEEKKIEVSDGDVREEMEKLLGPDVVLNLDKMEIKFDEAWEMIKTELIVRKMTNMMVRAKAAQEVTPKDVRTSYEELAAQNPFKEIWRYQVFSVRSDSEEKSQNVASTAKQILEEQKIPFEKLTEHLQEMGALDETTQVKLSEVFERTTKDLSLSHKAILQTLATGSSSSSLLQNSKQGEVYLTQLFHLFGFEREKFAPLAEMEHQLQNELIQREVSRCSEEYLDKLYKRFGFKEEFLSQILPEDFVPFSLR